jgi:hypothetical protein
VSGGRAGTAARAGAVFALTLAGLQVLQQVVGAFDPRASVSALIALTAATVTFALDRLRQGRQAVNERDGRLDAALTFWPLRRLREVDRRRLGVFPPRLLDGAPADADYVPREIDARLRAAIRPGRFVLVLGPPRAGKSRTALEAGAGDAWLIVPRDAAGLRALADVYPPPGAVLAEGTVLWLDDLERYVEALDAGVLDRILGYDPPPAVVATTAPAASARPPAARTSPPSRRCRPPPRRRHARPSHRGDDADGGLPRLRRAVVLLPLLRQAVAAGAGPRAAPAHVRRDPHLRPRGNGLRERFRFQPDAPGLVFRFRYLGDLDGDGEEELIGGYGVPGEASEALLPFTVDWDEGRGRYRLTSLQLTAPVPVATPSALGVPYVAAYRRRLDLRDRDRRLSLAGFRVQDFAVVEPTGLISGVVVKPMTPTLTGTVELRPSILRIAAGSPALIPCRLAGAESPRILWKPGRLLANVIRERWAKLAASKRCIP